MYYLFARQIPLVNGSGSGHREIGAASEGGMHLRAISQRRLEPFALPPERPIISLRSLIRAVDSIQQFRHQMVPFLGIAIAPEGAHEMYSPPDSATTTKSNLRELIVEALYSTSANDLPALSVSLGLAPGDAQEAFNSKRRYVRNRIGTMSFDDLVALARRTLLERNNFALREAINLIEELDSPKISPLTRRHLFQALNDYALSGQEPLLPFLRRFWPIDEMRWGTASGETASLADAFTRHAVDHDDMSNEDVLNEVGAKECSQSLLFALLEAVVHPETRAAGEQERLIGVLNPILARDGYSLVASGNVSGYPVFSVRRVQHGCPSDAGISQTLSAFDPDAVHAAWRKALERRTSDPEGAITVARSLLETVCKHIIEDAGGVFHEKDDLPTLYRAAAERMNLAPDQHTEQVFKAILGSCQNVVNSLATLRNKLSDAHGRGRRPARPLPRHAELAVNLAGTMATFLISTWHARTKDTDGVTLTSHR